MKEPTTNNLDDIVPGRLTSAELRAMALRQQQQIDSQHQLLATKEQRLRFLKQQEVRNAVANAEGERLRRLRERVEAQESKLRRLRALRGQVDLQKTYNVTLSNDLDSIRALFSEKEKELSLAVAKVEALTRQLEDLRRDRRCPINLIAGGSTTGQPLPPQASRELEKLRRELMYRNQLSLQQDARLHLQREALQQRQAELRSVDQRIYELQTRLQRKKAANVQTNQTQQQQQQQQTNISPNHIIATQQQQQQQVQQNPQQQQQQQHSSTQNHNAGFNTAPGRPGEIVDGSAANYPPNHMAPKTGVAALKQQLLQKQANQAAAAAAAAAANGNQPGGYNNKFAHVISRANDNRNIPRGNVAAVEPYIHTPQKSTITPTSSYLGNILKHAAATANTNQQNQLIQEHTHAKLNLANSGHPTNATAGHSATSNTSPNFFMAESDESKLAKKMLTAAITSKQMHSAEAAPQTQVSETTSSASSSVATTTTTTMAPNKVDTSHHIYAEVGPKKRDLVKEVTANLEANHPSTTSSQTTSKIPKSITTATSASALISKLNSAAASGTHISQREKSDLEKKAEISVTSETLLEKNTHQLTVHSMPLGAANKSVATGVSNSSTTSCGESGMSKPKPLASGNLAVPPRKPISSVAPTSVSSSIPKMITYSPKVNRVAPNVVSSSLATTVSTSTSATTAVSSTATANDRPALPPKPHKMSSASSTETNQDSKKSSLEATTSSSSSATLTTTSTSSSSSASTLPIQNINDNLPIKAKPLTIRKQPLSEQPRLKSSNSNNKAGSNQQNSRKSELNSNNNNNYLYNDRRSTTAELSSETNSEANSTPQYSPNIQHSQSASNIPLAAQQQSSSQDETDRSDGQGNSGNQITEDKSPDSLKRRLRSMSAGNNASSTASGNGKPKLTRRVSFDPLALLLDASLEGELELVKKTAMQVANPSAANDEGITALHNAICAGHIDIVKFLVEFGCDVNAQDSDGWTPLHCAASCNNLAMVKFLVENGACLFAATLSDHETPAEKCEEDEEGFDGCSEYLYSIQEKLGILHAGEVYAVFSYEAQNSDELTFTVNDRLVILRKGDDAESEWWWAKNDQNEEGYVPRNLLGLYPRVPPQTTNYAD
ncbi:apoptosis-stimulating of p53 protein 1 isoform X2 [Musca domestica]|uniref:Apoptosis-stimulating of p53 protein 1 isoform X2 n=1 Tax=Musca domestica TaxID=7370 RepID=A0ABM3URA9_MUSDO|nr:apoptosis-stimulating of p53 protein 1 isoform X2 [Musca domestica]XP_058976071.1 apoptosis-stimulating of p53 protein 1 isoform X2 [Musca domestica]XP_058976072.1 apoptosis-stimulating of p53 protein 1 isoform X2 [Musca domestica]